jgi:hypothetical protein
MDTSVDYNLKPLAAMCHTGKVIHLLNTNLASSLFSNQNLQPSHHRMLRYMTFNLHLAQIPTTNCRHAQNYSIPPKNKKQKAGKTNYE